MPENLQQRAAGGIQPIVKLQPHELENLPVTFPEGKHGYENGFFNCPIEGMHRFNVVLPALEICPACGALIPECVTQ